MEINHRLDLQSCWGSTQTQWTEEDRNETPSHMVQTGLIPLSNLSESYHWLQRLHKYCSDKWCLAQDLCCVAECQYLFLFSLNPVLSKMLPIPMKACSYMKTTTSFIFTDAFSFWCALEEHKSFFLWFRLGLRWKINSFSYWMKCSLNIPCNTLFPPSHVLLKAVGVWQRGLDITFLPAVELEWYPFPRE